MFRVCGVLRSAKTSPMTALGVILGDKGSLCVARTASSAANKMFPKDEFQSRHIGPRDFEQREMLDFLGYKVCCVCSPRDLRTKSNSRGLVGNLSTLRAWSWSLISLGFADARRDDGQGCSHKYPIQEQAGHKRTSK